MLAIRLRSLRPIEAGHDAETITWVASLFQTEIGIVTASSPGYYPSLFINKPGKMFQEREPVSFVLISTRF